MYMNLRACVRSISLPKELLDSDPIILRKILKMDLQQTESDPALFSSRILNP